MAVKHQKWWKEMQPRRDLVKQKALANDLAFKETLGSMELYAWYTHRVEAGLDDIHPYHMHERRKLK